ncbi:MAG: hypothetical protein Q8P67_11420, partial [archaeon]|nr:hypothetical protein [archaeon]
KSLEVLEINHRLLSQADLVRSIFHSSDEVPDFSGFLAIMTARKPDFVIRDHFAVSPLSILPISADVRRALTGDPNRPSITCKRPRTH